MTNYLAFTEGFSKLSFNERIQRLKEMGILTEEEARRLENEGEHFTAQFIENAIGHFHLPFGVAVNFVIDGKHFVIPMAIEESSVIASASKTAQWISKNGGITTKILGNLAIGQIQIPRLKRHKETRHLLKKHKKELIELVNQGMGSSLVKHGGGLKDIRLRRIKRSNNEEMGVIHIMVDTGNAMGANIINQTAEFLKPHIEALTGEHIGMCILSNLIDTHLTSAEVVIHNIKPELGLAIEEGSLFSQLDPYRAATNNKGVMNAVDAVLIATGNDWRAVEASVHAYAAQRGRYRSITQWKMHGNDLHGKLIAPLPVGIVGGVTRVHPMAKLGMKILGITQKEDLSRIIAAVGLVQNLGAIKALVTTGIVMGHMKLHIANIALAVGCSDEELPLLKEKLMERLQANRHVTESDGLQLLSELRSNR